MKKIIAFFLIAAFVVGCGASVRTETAAERFVNNLNWDDPYESYYLVKDPTASAGYIVLEVNPGEYYAIDITDPLRYDYLFDVDYFWDWAIPVWSVGSGYFEDSAGYLYEKKSQTSKDLAKIGAKLERARNRALGDHIAAEFGLSEKRGGEIARLVNEWKSLSKQRSMTDAEGAAFSKELLGFNLVSAAKTVKQGDSQEIQKLLKVAAKTNDTTPENMQDLMEQYFQ